VEASRAPVLFDWHRRQRWLVLALGTTALLFGRLSLLVVACGDGGAPVPAPTAPPPANTYARSSNDR